ncbi:hypothetical protein PoB_007547000 [Plakobranchus ocellatus]|uniref:Uncharacterized protein n=1 Tax=Plakobranchus ocellatus TaxID=259542 RepID=A0AAV4DY82_9GAST|nr:hypothetical protein PoB_007547000 [Plakobranchus ocellatus]
MTSIMASLMQGSYSELGFSLRFDCTRNLVGVETAPLHFAIESVKLMFSCCSFSWPLLWRLATVKLDQFVSVQAMCLVLHVLQADAGVIAGADAFAVAITVDDAGADAFAVAITVDGAGADAFAVAITVDDAGADAFAVAITVHDAGADAVAIAITADDAGADAFAIAITVDDAGADAVAIAITVDDAGADAVADAADYYSIRSL